MKDIIEGFLKFQRKLDLEKVDDPDGGSRAVITIDGKYLPTKPF